MADNELHPVVELMLARMESHPEEFDDMPKSGTLMSTEDRWWRVIDWIQNWGSEAEQVALREGMRKVKLNAAHEMALDELLNGDERRRKRVEDEANYNKMAQQTALSQAQLYNNQYSNAQNALTNNALSAQPTWTTSTYYDTTAPNSTSRIAAIKKALGL